MMLTLTKAADFADAYKKSVEAYEADYAYNEVVKGISEERKLQSEIFKLNKQKYTFKIFTQPIITK